MSIIFENNIVYEVPEWVKKESILFERLFDGDSSMSIKIGDLTGNKSLHKIESWRFILNDGYFDIHVIYENVSLFLDLWCLIQFKKILGFYIKPVKVSPKIIGKKRYPMFESLLVGLQKYFIVNKRFNKSMLDETVKMNDIDWLTYGYHYFLKEEEQDLKHLWDHYTIRVGYENSSNKCNYFMFYHDYERYLQILNEELDIKLIEHIPKDRYPSTIEEFFEFSQSDEYAEYIRIYEENKEEDSNEPKMKRVKSKINNTLNDFLGSFTRMNIIDK